MTGPHARLRAAAHASRTLDLDTPFDLVATLRLLVRGATDPTARLSRDRFVWTTRTSEGPAALRVDLETGGRRVHAEAWGPGAERVLESLPRLLGLDDDRFSFDPTPHRLVAELDRRMAGMRIGATGAVVESLVPAILEQKVTGTEAVRAIRGLVARYGEPAPGPLGLRLPPAPAVLAALPYYAYHPFGVEQRRADTIRRVAALAASLERLADAPLDEAYRRMTAIPGIGPWTAAEVATRALGDADGVSVGDFHLPNLVAWALAGEPRADDARMLELLAPWAPQDGRPGQRGRVIRLLEASGLSAPRRGPRLAPRSIAGI